VKKAQDGDFAAVLELGKDGSPEARMALESLTERLQEGVYNRALRVARAKAGNSDDLLDVAGEVLFGNSGLYLSATQELPYLGGAISLQLLELLLDDFTEASNGGDLHYLANAQNALIVLPEAVPSGPAIVDPLIHLHDYRRKWHAWFDTDPAITSLSTTEMQALSAAAEKRLRLSDVGVLLLLAGRPMYETVIAWTFQPSNAMAGDVMKEALRIAYGDQLCSEGIVRRIVKLGGPDQRIILKVLVSCLR